jgi:DNA-directed RNA polymerase subunit RPC12/RpoP
MVGKKMVKLHCFRCGHKFVHFERIYRNENGYPYCNDCILEEIGDTWEEPDRVFEDLEDYGYSYQKYMADMDFYDCPRCGVSVSINKGHDEFREIVCWDCGCWFFVHDGKVTESYKDEDEYIAKTNQKEGIKNGSGK